MPTAWNSARWWLLAILVIGGVVAALVVPLPSAIAVRDEVRALGPWAPVVFLLVQALVTATPFPRTPFTLGAGLLFGPWLGLLLCVVACTVSAALGFALARRLGGRAVRRLGAGRVRMLESRLSSRGLLTVTSARLLPALPFAPLNYTFGVTTVGWRPYMLGTAVGLIPGTAAIVLLGDAVTGSTSPAMLAVFLVSGAFGVLGVVLSARRPAAAPRVE